MRSLSDQRQSLSAIRIVGYLASFLPRFSFSICALVPYIRALVKSVFVPCRRSAVITGRHYKTSWGKPAKGSSSLLTTLPLSPIFSFSPPPPLSFRSVHPIVVTTRIRIISVDRRYFFCRDSTSLVLPFSTYDFPRSFPPRILFSRHLPSGGTFCSPFSSYRSFLRGRRNPFSQRARKQTRKVLPTVVVGVVRDSPLQVQRPVDVKAIFNWSFLGEFRQRIRQGWEPRVLVDTED